MTIFATPAVGFTAGYYPATTQQTSNNKFNPKTTPIFIDPKTGELVPLKPGIYDPNQKEKSNKGLYAALAAIGTAVLAFVFRGKIKNIPWVKNTAIPALKNAKAWAAKQLTTLKNSKIVQNATQWLDDAWKGAKKYAGKAWNAVKNLFTKAPAAAGTP